jgi:hypothetical protein
MKDTFTAKVLNKCISKSGINYRLPTEKMNRITPIDTEQQIMFYALPWLI